MGPEIVALPDECCAAPFESIPDVVERMTAIGDRLPEQDGLRYFNQMYLGVTKAVLDATQHGVFSNSEFLARLDVVFANRYLTAVQASAGLIPRAPHCWSALIVRRNSNSVAPIQFALAGMTSHIVYDLVISVVQTLEEFGLRPESVKADYTRVNVILDELEPGTRRGLAQSELARELEAHVGQLLDDCGDWGIAAAREAAFVDAELLWTLRRHRVLTTDYERTLDAATALANDCLLMPAKELRSIHLAPVHDFWHGRMTSLPGLNRLRHVQDTRRGQAIPVQARSGGVNAVR
jgi:hypothetical protein